MRRRRCAAGLIALLVLCLTVGCASIPDSSDVIPVKRMDESSVSVPIPVPPPNVDAFTLVRSFVDAAAEPENDFAAARLHLTAAAQRTWKPPRRMLIVDNVDTIPVPSPPGTPANVQWVSLQASKAGWLEPDESFVPVAGQYQVNVRVDRQSDGQWRIATPPPDLVVSRTGFLANYKPVSVYFLDRARTGVVPDVRYVVSQPASTLPRRVVDLLTMGPSQSFQGALGTAIPAGVYPLTNVTEADDGALVVNFSSLGAVTQETRQLIAAQVVLSLESVSNSRVRLQEDGAPLLPRQEDLWPEDVASYDADGGPRPNLPGLAVVGERVRMLDSHADPVAGAAGSGQLTVLQAGVSSDGTQLAAVVRAPNGGVQLDVGPYGEDLTPVPLTGAFMTKPTWSGSSEFWTVVDGRDIVQVVRSPSGSWNTVPVDAQAFEGGQEVTDLRLAPDGTRVAGVINGQIVVSGVSEVNGQTVLGQPVTLSGGPKGAAITGVAWISGDSLVAITNSSSVPVVEVSVDGFKWTDYASENLTQPLTAVTVAPGQKVVVADQSGVWQASNPDDVWHLLPVPIGGSSIPFYAG